METSARRFLILLIVLLGSAGTSLPAHEVGDQVQVYWGSKWYAARILKKSGGRYYITYKGYHSSWNEWVTRDRIRAIQRPARPERPKSDRPIPPPDPGPGKTDPPDPVFDLTRIYPTLSEQIRRSLRGTDRDEASRLLNGYAKTQKLRSLMAFVVKEDSYRRLNKPNAALAVLMHLLKNNATDGADDMTIAIALANNYYYGRGNQAVKRMVLRDVVKQWQFYRDIVAWQTGQSLGYRLDRVPFEAKVYWAARERVYYSTHNTGRYVNRVPSIEDMRRLRRDLLRAGVHRSANLGDLNANVIKWFYAKLLPSKQLPRDKEHYYFPDLFKYYKRTGRLPAEDCVPAATHYWVIFRALGIPALTYYQDFRAAGHGRGINHEIPAYYDDKRGLWVSSQTGRPWPRFTAENVPVYFEIFKPLWHDFMALEGWKLKKESGSRRVGRHAHIGGATRINAHRERTRNGPMRRYILAGITDAEMKKIFRMEPYLRYPAEHLTRDSR